MFDVLSIRRAHKINGDTLSIKIRYYFTPFVKYTYEYRETEMAVVATTKKREQKRQICNTQSQKAYSAVKLIVVPFRKQLTKSRNILKKLFSLLQSPPSFRPRTKTQVGSIKEWHL